MASFVWAFNTRTERAEQIGVGAVASQTYVTSIDVDPLGRYLYYVPGAHGGADRDGSAVVQFDVVTRRKKVIAFLRTHYEKTYGFIPTGTFGTAVSPDGGKVYVTWHGTRRLRAAKRRFDTCALTVVHVPAAERRP